MTEVNKHYTNLTIDNTAPRNAYTITTIPL